MFDPNHPPPLTSYVETYGSNASFCVANPFTKYWQNSYAGVVERLVREDEVGGVYIDQIGAASPERCWDTAHGHTLGGGDYWTVGYQKMMDAIQTRIKDVKLVF